ncbi:MAG: cobalt transporter CbiM [candidate division NC10 bacterium]|nr:cobalt transporter CbiM [candidate division NC10 bacterium]
MHIPDGYLGPQTYGALYALMAPLWFWASRTVKKTLRARQVPLLALGAAFAFVIMMFNVPTPGGSTGHAVGGALIAIVLGPWAAMLSLSVTLVVQALLFGDGGLTAIGANTFNMAFIMPFSAYSIYKLLKGKAEAGSKRALFAAGAAGYLSLNLSALFTGVELGLQPLLAHKPDGTPLYNPYPLQIAVPVMAAQHLLFFGWIEAVVTALVVAYLAKTDPALLEPSTREKE